MTEARRYDESIKVSFGGQEITAEPLKGLVRIKAFEQAIVDEINALASTVQDHTRGVTKVSTEVLLESGVDQARLLKLGLPDVITDEVLEQSTARERLGLLTDLCYLNNLGRLAPFLSIEMLLDLGSRLNLIAPVFPTPVPSGSSSEQESPGATSSAN
jgi:hypothetical protein